MVVRTKPPDEETCPHLQVNNWFCNACKIKVPQFQCIFDDMNGKVKTFMKIVYDNEFLQDFKNVSFDQVEKPQDNIPKKQNTGIMNNSIETLYQAYQPNNVTELREYILFLICKKIKKSKQNTIIGTGQCKHLSTKLMRYLTELDTAKKKLLQKYNNDILLFDSIFESGNLLQADYAGSNSYQLYMQVDTNTKGHQQWFYFRVRNTQQHQKYNFKIMNFTKPGTTNNHQRIHFKSKLSDQKVQSFKKRRNHYYYALQFEFQFDHLNDSVEFAFALPFSYTDIVNSFLEVENSIREPNSAPILASHSAKIENPQKSIFYKREELSRSITGLPLYIITIGKDSKTQKKRPIVAITSRVHSGETPGSHVFQGIFELLTSDTQQAKFLRRFYTFILVPILNPDGVVCGNYRNSVSGVDLNRQWICPDIEFHPEIYHIKQYLKDLYEKDKRNIWVYCDLHGHSKKKNSFFYGCNTAANGGFLSWTIVRLLPRIFAKNTHLFNYKDCRFKVEPYKIGTGRVVAWKQFNVTHSFTLENSFFGYDFGENEHKLFEIEDYKEVGLKLCQSIYELHFLWKDIRRELRLTNGWLKPKRLLDITGVPAAQILSEELSKKKKEELKKKAIEQYEQFLKKYFNATPIKKPNRNQTNHYLQGQGNNNSQLKLMEQTAYSSFQKTQQSRNNTSSKQNTYTSITVDSTKSRNNLIPNESNSIFLQGSSSDIANSKRSLNSQTQESALPQQQDIYKLLQGLIKIQALIRGFLTRKKVKLPKVNKSPLKSITQLYRFQFESQQPQQSKHQQQSSLYNVEEMIKMANWRQYFQDQELEEAYQHVEVEKQDDPNEGESDGSSQNPSEDNFDLREMYEKIYQVSNIEEISLEREQVRAKFAEEIQQYLEQDLFLCHLDNAFSMNKKKDINKLINQRKNTAKPAQPIQKKQILLTNLAQSISQNNDSTPNKRQLNLKIGFQSQDKQSTHQRKTNQQMYQTGMNIDSNILGRSNTQSPLHNNRQDDGHLQQHQLILEGHQDRISAIISSQQKQHQQQVTQSRNQQLPVSGGQISNINQLHLKMIQSQMSGMFANKKENINQVIKDCFITRKYGHQNDLRAKQNKSFQKSQFHSQGDEGFRLHSQTYYQGDSQGKSKSLLKKRMINSKSPISHQDQFKRSIYQQKATPDTTKRTAEQMIAAENPQESASSLFMKYVKQKLVKKIKGDSIPTSVTDKYLDIYKELLEREKTRYNCQSVSSKYSKDKSSRNDQNQININMASPDQKFNFMKAQDIHQNSEQKQQHRSSSLLLSQEGPIAQSYSQYQNGYINDVSCFKQNHNSVQEEQKVVFPTISSFHATMDYKKKSREIINEFKQTKSQQQKQNSILYPYESYSLASGNGKFDQALVKPGNQETLQHEADILINQHKRKKDNVQSAHSLQSSIDQDIIQNIKNIYKEMKLHNPVIYSGIQSHQKTLKGGFIQQQRKIVSKCLEVGPLNMANNENVALPLGFSKAKQR